MIKSDFVISNSMSSKEHFSKLMEHARKITQELKIYDLELTPSVKDEATKKLDYARKVLASLEDTVLKMDAADPEICEMAYNCLISIKPHLMMAIVDLNKRIENNEYYKDPTEKNEVEEAKTEKREFDEELWKEAIKKSFEDRHVEEEENNDIIILGNYGEDEDVVEYEIIEEEIEEEVEE